MIYAFFVTMRGITDKLAVAYTQDHHTVTLHTGWREHLNDRATDRSGIHHPDCALDEQHQLTPKPILELRHAKDSGAELSRGQ